MNRGRRSKYALPILQVHAIRFMADMRAVLFVRSHVLFSYEFLNRALFYLNNVSGEPTIPKNICELHRRGVSYRGSKFPFLINDF